MSMRRTRNGLVSIPLERGRKAMDCRFKRLFCGQSSFFNLDPENDYQVMLRTHSRTGSSPISQQSIKTKAFVKSTVIPSDPEDLKISKLSHNSIEVTYKPPQEGLGYEVTSQAQGSSTSVPQVVKSKAQSKQIVEELICCTTYTITVHTMMSSSRSKGANVIGTTCK
ncbi:unnamed protein product [Protopolystoma xenopodis]|uniref:Fibronectin type-III domain-containing protein n=1 Tax=Protopolystoma xenopodis TaxID=117903 RepID=A0A448WQ36_9PLAT|nr:unnamed protein product [Protopolystoma xenopodis]